MPCRHGSRAKYWSRLRSDILMIISRRCAISEQLSYANLCDPLQCLSWFFRQIRRQLLKTTRSALVNHGENSEGNHALSKHHPSPNGDRVPEGPRQPRAEGRLLHLHGFPNDSNEIYVRIQLERRSKDVERIIIVIRSVYIIYTFYDCP